MNERTFFAEQTFHDASRVRQETIARDVSSYDMDSIISANLEDVAKVYKERYQMVVPQLKSELIHLLEPAKEISRRETVRSQMYSTGYHEVDNKYIQFTICVPFVGDASLFYLEPSSCSITLGKKMQATIIGNEIQIFYCEQIASTQSDLNLVYQKDIKQIEENLRRMRHDADLFNNDIDRLISQKLDERRKSAEASRSVISTLKIPIKKRDDIPQTYIIPTIRKEPVIIDSQSSKTFTPEPTLDLFEYERILVIIKDMALAMERSPKTFASLDEEDIRNFILILLNGHYQGSATGETFNGNGKTDILIRHNNANAFIAECKFWHGQKKMEEAINQLLGYITWRDTKTSIIIFNKQSDLSDVMSKAKQTIEAHKLFKGKYSLSSKEFNNNETVCGYKFTHPTDSEKEIFLTLMAFQITG